MIKIVDNTKTTFKNLNLEDTFMYNDRLLMKISLENKYNAYDFTYHRIAGIADDAEVKYVPSKLTLC